MNVFEHKELTQDDIDMYFFYRKNGINAGLFERYHRYLIKANTYVDAFNLANEEFFTLFGEYRYSTYDSFRKLYKKYLNE